MGVVVSYLFKEPEQPEIKMLPLTAEQITIVKETWTAPWNGGDCADSGEAILFRFFEKYPDNQNKFLAFKNTPLLSLKGTPGFRTHSVRILTVFNNSIEVLGTPTACDDLEKIWCDVATNHMRRKIEKKSYLQLREVILEVMTKAFSLDPEQQQAWANLIDHVYLILFKRMGK